MKGDVIVVEPYHVRAANEIIDQIIAAIKAASGMYIITVAGESGSGKSETARALQDVLAGHNVKAVILGQDDYFVLPPKSNDARRREDPEWLGPHIEVRLDLLEQNLLDAIHGKASIQKPLIDYGGNTIEKETINLKGVRVVIAEGTYTSLLRHVNKRIFIARTRVDTLEHRKKRNRGDEAGDPFVEGILSIEHKIIAGHQNLADFVITKAYDVIIKE